MAFKREIEMIIASQNSNISSGILISDLDIDFDITRTNARQNNQSKFTVYNAKSDTREKILSTGNLVILKAGYEDEKNLGIVSTGTIIESNSKKNRTDWITEIECLDLLGNQDKLEYAIVSISYKSKTPFVAILQDISGQLGIPISGLENITFTMNNGFVYAGNFTNLIKRITNILYNQNLGFYYDNNEMVIYRIGPANSAFSIANISKNTGLLGNIEQIINKDKDDNKKRIKFDYMINPKLKPNSVFILDSESIKGVFIAEKIRIIGDNYGGNNFKMTIEAVE